MRLLLISLGCLLMAAWCVACAETGICAEAEVFEEGECVLAGPSKPIPIGCQNSFTPDASSFDWELTVASPPIESGKSFFPTFAGAAIFDEPFLDAALEAVGFGFRDINLLGLQATVHVRSGATGADVTLGPEPRPFTCGATGPPCDPEDNTECESACGQYYLLPTSTDCVADGVCAREGKTGPGSQCARFEFCITGDLQIPLERKPGTYTAESEGEVLFGWADEPILKRPALDDPMGPLGWRGKVGPIEAVFHCTMGDAPNSALVSLPIETR